MIAVPTYASMVNNYSQGAGFGTGSNCCRYEGQEIQSWSDLCGTE